MALENYIKNSGKLDKSLEKCYEQVTYYLNNIPEPLRNSNYPNQIKAFNKYIDFVEDFIKDYNESKNKSF